MKSTLCRLVVILAAASVGVGFGVDIVSALSMTSHHPARSTTSSLSMTPSTRRAFVGNSASAAAAAVGAALLPSHAAYAKAPEIYNTPSGIKYAILKEAPSKGSSTPLPGDIVAIEYTGYLTSGQIFDATHSEGKKNALLFKLEPNSAIVIPGLTEMVSQMSVGQKVQAIIPASLAYGDKGVCLDNGECLIPPGSTLVYDVTLKKSSIPPP